MAFYTSLQAKMKCKRIRSLLEKTFKLSNNEQEETTELDTFQSTRGYSYYKENFTIEEQPRPKLRRPLVHALGCPSRPDSYFSPATGLDYLTGLMEIALKPVYEEMQDILNAQYILRLPEAETLYTGKEFSSTFQKILFGSQRDFTMALLDPLGKEAVTFVRKKPYTNFKNCFRQEMHVFITVTGIKVGKIVQEHTLSGVIYTIYDNRDFKTHTLITGKRSLCGRLRDGAFFELYERDNLSPGYIIHTWEDGFYDHSYNICFPAYNMDLNYKILLIGAALLMDYTFFKETGCFGFM